MRLYNTLGREVQDFVPLKDGEVMMYNCGPTVYNRVHIGNLRAYVAQDLLKRFLAYKGYDVKHVMNITDIDDKIINALKDSDKDLVSFTSHYTDLVLEDMEKLNIVLPTVVKATDHIDEMVAIVKKLSEKGLAYEKDGSWYFSIEKQDGYGKLSNLENQDLQFNADGRLTDVDEDKEGVNDFVLWKAWKESDGDVFWETEIGKGRPGWHIECSAMSMKHLGEQIDIHCGGVDLTFPHHTNEIAQSEGCTGCKFVNYWVHNAHLLVDGEKMSKSLNNFYTLQDLEEKGIDLSIIRMMLLRVHYRQVLDFKFEAIDEVTTMVQGVNEILLDLSEIDFEGDETVAIQDFIDTFESDFDAALSDDLNISGALAAVHTYIHSISKHIKDITSDQARDLMDILFSADSVLGVFKSYYERYQERVDDLLTPEVVSLISARRTARNEKDYEKADALRDELRDIGLTVKDSDEGVSVRLV